MTKKLKKWLKSFTLVELIIVIAIVAILSVAAFLVVTKWIGKSRDARRLSDVGTMVRSVILYKSENGNVPMPSGEISTGEIINIEGKSELFSKVGTFGTETVGELDSLQKVPTDPSDDTQEYIYGVHANKKEFEVGVTLEGNEENAYANSVFASREKAKVDGNYKPKTVILSGNILKVIPSLLFLTSGSDIKNMGGSEVNFIVDGGNNKPYTVYGEDLRIDIQDKSVKIALGNKNASYEGVSLSGGTLTGVLEGIRNVSLGESEMKEIISFVKKKGYLGSYEDEEIENGIDEVLENYEFEKYNEQDGLESLGEPQESISGNGDGIDPFITSPLYGSCLEILNEGLNQGSGVYRIDFGEGGIYDIYCDMESDGGGWTLIAKYRGTSGEGNNYGLDQTYNVAGLKIETTNENAMLSHTIIKQIINGRDDASIRVKSQYYDTVIQRNEHGKEVFVPLDGGDKYRCKQLNSGTWTNYSISHSGCNAFNGTGPSSVSTWTHGCDYVGLSNSQKPCGNGILFYFIPSRSDMQRIDSGYTGSPSTPGIRYIR